MPGKDLKKGAVFKGWFYQSIRSILTAPCGALIFSGTECEGFFMPGKDLERDGSGNAGPV
jgi:hypothetical protein